MVPQYDNAGAACVAKVFVQWEIGMFRPFQTALVAAVLAISTTVGADEDKGEWIQLFNGKNLDGWTPKIKGYAAGENFGNTFRVEDGVLKVSYDQYKAFDGKFGHLFYKEPFSDYILRLEYRFVGNQ
jgi:hypothetical protein